MTALSDLAQSDVDALREALSSVTSVSEFKRFQCIWLQIALGLNSRQVAIAVGFTPSYIYRLTRLYLSNHGAFGPASSRGGRRRQNLTFDEERAMLAPYLRYARSGLGLNVAALHAHYERLVHRAVPKSTIYRLLHRHGASRYLNRRSAQR